MGHGRTPATGRHEEHPGVLYVYGIRNQSPLERRLLLARVPADAVPEPGKWRFYAGDGKWSSRLQDAAPIAEDLVNELSVEEYAAGGRPLLVMVHSEPVFGRHIFVRTASRPEGPWTRPTPVYSVPELDRNRTYFTYAAKGHLPLSRQGELLISYVVNSHDFGAMFKDATIYRPRFISIPRGPYAPQTVHRGCLRRRRRVRDAGKTFALAQSSR